MGTFMFDDEKENTHVGRLMTPKKEKKKKQYSFYLNEEIYKIFMESCKGREVSGSKVIEAYMRDFIEKYGKK